MICCFRDIIDVFHVNAVLRIVSMPQLRLQSIRDTVIPLFNKIMDFVQKENFVQYLQQRYDKNIVVRQVTRLFLLEPINKKVVN